MEIIKQWLAEDYSENKIRHLMEANYYAPVRIYARYYIYCAEGAKERVSGASPALRSFMFAEGMNRPNRLLIEGLSTPPTKHQ
jgi:hypothetical protein